MTLDESDFLWLEVWNGEALALGIWRTLICPQSCVTLRKYFTSLGFSILQQNWHLINGGLFRGTHLSPSKHFTLPYKVGASVLSEALRKVLSTHLSYLLLLSGWGVAHVLDEFGRIKWARAMTQILLRTACTREGPSCPPLLSSQ